MVAADARPFAVLRGAAEVERAERVDVRPTIAFAGECVVWRGAGDVSVKKGDGMCLFTAGLDPGKRGAPVPAGGGLTARAGPPARGFRARVMQSRNRRQ